MDSGIRAQVGMVIALLGLLLLAACAQQPAAFPTGRYSTTIPAEAIGGNEARAALVGDWQLALTPEGRYTIVNKGVDVVRGSYTITDDQVTFTEESGIFAQLGPRGTSIYTWSLEQSALTFAAVDDADEDRRLVMVSRPWMKDEG